MLWLCARTVRGLRAQWTLLSTNNRVYITDEVAY